MSHIERRLKRINELELLISKEEISIHRLRGNKKLRCAHCAAQHKICELEVIQTYHYVSPHGCMGGDYWNEDELNYLCPDCKVRNRIFVMGNKDWNIDYEEREQNNKFFKRNFKNLFKNVIDNHEKIRGSFVNNYILDYFKME